MESLKELFKIGIGPSSSHTMGPEKACKFILEKHPQANHFEVILYGSLALTGKGHGTDIVIKKILGENTKIIFDLKHKHEHPNTMDILCYKDNNFIEKERVFSVGGGKILFSNQTDNKTNDVYSFNTFEEIKNYCKQNNKRIYEYVFETEPNIKEYLLNIWQFMKKSILEGLNTEGYLPGGLNVQRKAKILFNEKNFFEDTHTMESRILSSYAFAVSEQNASQNTIVTAPTCGSCGVLPACLYFMQNKYNLDDEEIVKGLATSGLIGNIIKTNASLSGAECGCQAEIGSACAMASAGISELMHMSIEQIEYSSEISLEHHLGLTCDPVKGLVQIPCIERNAVAAMRALDSVTLAKFLTQTRKISLDLVIKTMYETGKDMQSRYKETSKGGLAKLYKKAKKC